MPSRARTSAGPIDLRSSSPEIRRRSYRRCVGSGSRIWPRRIRPGWCRRLSTAILPSRNGCAPLTSTPSLHDDHLTTSGPKRAHQRTKFQPEITAQPLHVGHADGVLVPEPSVQIVENTPHDFRVENRWCDVGVDALLVQPFT